MVDWDNSYPDDSDDWGEFIPPADDDLPDAYFLGQANLLSTGELFANVYAYEPTMDFHLADVSYAGIDALLGRDEADHVESWADHAEDLPFGFDARDPDIRGPFPEPDDVDKFIEQTGIYWADIYYDEESDSYYIDVSY